MPSWIDEGGYDWFGKIECKRCHGRFETDKNGEVPAHKCIGGIYKSDSNGREWHYPVRISDGLDW